jgi:AraC-like DNA-binding protein
MQTLSYALDTTWRTLLRDLDIQPANALRRAGLGDDLLHQPSVRLLPQEYYRLWNSIEEESGDPLFPIRLCEAIRSESFSPPLFAALCSPNLVVAAQRMAQYKTLIGPMRLDITEAADDTTIELTWLEGVAPPPASLAVMELLFCVALVRMGTREPIRPVKVTTTAPPSPSAPYQAFLGVTIDKGHRHCVTFSSSDALRPFLTSNEPMWAAFEPALRQRLADIDSQVTTTTRLRAALHEAIPSGLVSMEAVARKLAFSKRTLQRRIEAEGTSFQQVLNETREALAKHYLIKTSLPPTEISFLLGFDEPNSFYRAFRSWTGRTPDDVRRAPPSP